MKRIKVPCPVCSQSLASNGLPAHLKAKHPNYEAAPRKPISTVSVAENEARVSIDMELGSFLEMVKTIKAA